MKQPILILGTGDHALVLFETLKENPLVEVLGALSRPGAPPPRSALPVLGDDSLLQTYNAREVQLVNGIGSVTLPDRRSEIFRRCRQQGFRFFDVIHPRSIVSHDLQKGQGLQVMAGAIIQRGCRLGDNVLVNTGVIVEHDCIIDSHCHVASGATLCGRVTIGPGSHIGAGSTIIQGRTAGAKSLIGAGSVVISDIPAHSRVAGVPAGGIG